MNKAIICVGCSGSGKSTFAENLCNENPDWVEINRDNIRFPYGKKDWLNYKFSKAKEDEVTRIWRAQLESAIDQGKNIVISDTNLSKCTVDEYLKNNGYEVEFRLFYCDWDTLVKRNAQREGGVTLDVLRKQWVKFSKLLKVKSYNKNTNLPKAILCDVDGTVSEMGCRGAYCWHRVKEDNPIPVIVDMVKGYYALGYKIVFLTGRDSVCYDDTKQWLSDVFNFDIELYSRPEGNREKDYIIKERLFFNHVANKYCVEAVIDDRPQVLRMWLDIGLKTVCVSDPYIEF